MTKVKRLLLVTLFGLLLGGCATYSFRKGESPYNNGFVAARYDRVLPEYTLGKDNSVPDEKTAKERFQRRRKQVEAYYKKMGYIENRFKQSFIDSPIFILQSVIGIFRMPGIAIRDYKYNHDPLYKAEVDKKDDAAYRAEKERIKALKDELNAYIQKDLEKNEPSGSAPAAVTTPPVNAKVEAAPKPKESETAKPTAIEQVKEKPLESKQPVQEPVKLPPVEASLKIQAPVNLLTAVITAKPLKGLSPLTVQFSAAKSSSSSTRLVSYAWDFGDGDTSTKKNTSNTYFSTTYGTRKFTATLTVKDDKGNTASTALEIEVATE